MDTTYLFTWMPLQKRVINNTVVRPSPGVYLLRQAGEGMSSIEFVGRSDENIADGLTQHLGAYREFTFVRCEDGLEAYDIQCAFYHQFGPPDNHLHPNPPFGQSFRCPICGR